MRRSVDCFSYGRYFLIVLLKKRLDRAKRLDDYVCPFRSIPFFSSPRELRLEQFAPRSYPFPLCHRENSGANMIKTASDVFRSVLRDVRNRQRLIRRAGMVCLHVANIACGIHLCTQYLLRVSFMDGPSMFPTLAGKGEIVIEDRLTLRFFPDRITRGDLVVLKSPIMPERIICKRVLGLPGDIVCVDPTGETAPSTEHIVVPKGHIWISGDNAPFSRDSRVYGPVSMSLLQGKLLTRVWPISKITVFKNPLTYID